MRISIVDEARQYLADQKGHWPQICEETELGYSWLCKFAAGTLNNPTVRQVEKLLAHKAKRRPHKRGAA